MYRSYLSLLTLLLVGCVQKTPENFTKEEVIGRARYRQSCVQCHNYNPKLPSVGPALYGVKRELLIDRLTNGYRGMPKLPEKLKHVDNLCVYLRCQ